MSFFGRVAALVAGAVIVAGVQSLAQAQSASPDDVAKFLAGIQPSDGSPLTPLARSPGWQRHARWFEANWDALEKRQLSRIRAWSERHLKERNNTLYYMFSGPDFLYANAFFPEANTYLMSGLEPIGPLPVVSERTISALPRIQQSIGSSLRFSFFITHHMRNQLTGGELAGTLPILYVYIARSGKTIQELSLVNLDRDGNVHPGRGEARGMVPGVKIVLASGSGPAQTLYYFRTDVSNGGVQASGFLKFAATLGNGNSLLKSASYLMHSGNFTRVRDFVLEHSQHIVQDDSGIPLAAFRSDSWDFQPFGAYLGPIAIFPGRSQPRLGELFRRAKAPPLDFGIGYRHRGHDSNLLLAVRRDQLKVGSPPATPSTAAPATPSAAAPATPSTVAPAPPSVATPATPSTVTPATPSTATPATPSAAPTKVRPVPTAPAEVRPVPPANIPRPAQSAPQLRGGLAAEDRAPAPADRQE